MTPANDSVELLHGDCLGLMLALPDASVDMVLCDLPYGATQNKWDAVIPFDALWREYERICRGAIVLTAAQPFTSALVMSRPRLFKYQWVWEKSSVTGHLNAHRMPMRKHEDVLVFAKGNAPYFPQGLVQYQKVKRRGHNGSNFGKSGAENFQEFTNYPRSIIQFNNDPKPVHPTQKPVALMEYLIRTYTNEGDTVLDNCMGSGTTGVACVNTGRRFIGMEMEEKYFSIAQTRIAAVCLPVPANDNERCKADAAA
jgi:site-specific DNA-methyltransferase (adenine-specific)